jgi:uncharacterized protein HemY
MDLGEFISKFPDKCGKLKTSPIVILRNLIEKYKEDSLGKVGQLWIYLAELFIRTGDFGMARDIFEEALEQGSITSVTDFTIVFNAYVRFER